MKISHYISPYQDAFKIEVIVDNATINEDVRKWNQELKRYIVPKDLIHSIIELGLDAINSNEDYNDGEIVKQYLSYLNNEQKEIALDILCSELKVERKES